MGDHPSLPWGPLVLGGLLAFPATVSAQQAGTVLSETKISDTAGGFGGSLDDQDQFGRCVVRVGDLDGDGVAELAVNAVGDDDGVPNAGAVWILFMNPDGTVASEQKISATAGGFGGDLDQGDGFGRCIAPLGDLDGDGVEDLAVGANLDDDGGVNRGAVWILFLNADGTVASYQKISSTQGGLGSGLLNLDEFGRSIAQLDDMDGDGVPDLAVGCSGIDDGGDEEEGGLWVLFMNADATVRSKQKISETAGGFTGTLDALDRFGSSLANLGDLDGDGVCDVAVGAPRDSDGGLYRGAVYVLFLRPDGTVSSHQKISDTAGGFTGTLQDRDKFGYSLACLGDIDGDGVQDIATGAFNDRELQAKDGAVWILFLDTDGTVQSHQKINEEHGGFAGIVTGDELGVGLGALGDHDGDGLADLAVGARLDDDGGSDHGAVWVLFLDGVAQSLTAGFSGVPTSGAWPLAVSFSDESTGGPISWAWDFGDGGTSSFQDPTHVYSSAGTYTVSLTVSDGGGSDTLTRVDYVAVSDPPPPTADFVGSPTSGTRPLTVSFTDLSLDDPTSWSWDFGDGGTSSEENPAHTYSSAGTYTVGLTASNANGSDLLSRVDYVLVNDPMPPTADFAGVPTSGGAPLLVAFTDESSGDPTSWSWDFGDGGVSSAQDPSHVYAAEGTYTVSLTASNANGSDTRTLIDYVSVTATPMGEGYVLSKNADFSTDDRAFDTGDTLHILVFSDQVDFDDLANAQWQLTDPNQARVRETLTNNGDGTYTASYDLSGLPSAETAWTWAVRVIDNSSVKFQVSEPITVDP